MHQLLGKDWASAYRLKLADEAHLHTVVSVTNQATSPNSATCSASEQRDRISTAQDTSRPLQQCAVRPPVDAAIHPSSRLRPPPVAVVTPEPRTSQLRTHINPPISQKLQIPQEQSDDTDSGTKSRVEENPDKATYRLKSLLTKLISKKLSSKGSFAAKLGSFQGSRINTLMLLVWR